MKFVKVGAGLLALGLAAGAQADVTTLSENFDNFAGLGAAGWVFTNNSEQANQNWFAGNSGIFDAQAGAPGAYAAASFNSTNSLSGVIDNWLISPVFSMGSSGTLDFWTRGADDLGYFDQLEVRFSSGTGSAVSGFTTLLAAIGDGASQYPGGWNHYSLALGAGNFGRVAFRYTSSDASIANYVGIDTVSVTVVPEPASIALTALALAAAAGAVRRRKAAAVSTPSMA